MRIVVERWTEEPDVIVFLADLQNSYYRYLRNSVPLGMGYVAAYLEETFEEAVEIHQFRKFEEIYEALKETTPHLVAFGSYSWNTSLTLKTAQYLRDRDEDLIIAVGGPDVSQLANVTRHDLQRNPQIDFYLADEGEEPMRNLIEAYLGHLNSADLRRARVPGCLSRESPETDGVFVTRVQDINQIPSPYLSGLMDRFLQDIDYLPIIQTARGCPYQCTFCVAGKDSWGKVKAFEVDRVKAEIDYIADRAANAYLRLADENFGILHRDVELAEYIRDKGRKVGFPSAVSIYTDKHPTERVMEVNKVLKDLLPFNISFQSATHDVLQNIKRINLKDREVQKAISFAHEHDLMLVTELIFGLPGETTESFLESIDKLIDYRFESIAINQLQILKGAEMDHEENRRRFQVETMFAMAENGYTQHEVENIEIDELVVANDSLSREEYATMNKFIAFFLFAHFQGYLRELLFLFETRGVRSTAMIMRALDDSIGCPTVYEFGEQYLAGFTKLIHDSPEEVVASARQAMRDNPENAPGVYKLYRNLVIDLLMGGRLEDVAAEIAATGRALYEDRHGSVPVDLDDELAVIQTIVAKAFIPLDSVVPETITHKSQFDVARWASGGYSKPLSEYGSNHRKTVALKIRNIQNYLDMWNADESDEDKYRKNFANINSSNRRRTIVDATVLESVAL